MSWMYEVEQPVSRAAVIGSANPDSLTKGAMASKTIWMIDMELSYQDDVLYFGYKYQLFESFAIATSNRKLKERTLYSTFCLYY